MSLPSISSLGRRSFLWSTLGGTLTLAGCGSNLGGMGFGGSGNHSTYAEQPMVDQSATPTGDILGTGSVRVALILPKSAGGQSAIIAGQLRNASLTWIDGDHLSPLTEPEKFVAVLNRVLPGMARAAA